MKTKLDQVIVSREAEITGILTRYGVKLYTP